MGFKRIENDYIYNEDYTELIIHSPTYGDFNIKFDNDDINIIKEYHWCINKCMNKQTTHIPIFYAGTFVKTEKNKQKSVLLHRLLMGEPDKMVVDHKNGDSLDNRKVNLRICTRAENRINNGMSIHNKSGITGVCWDNKNNKWIAYLMLHRKYKHLGYFDDIEDAAKARRDAEDLYFGEFARNNSVTEDNKIIS